MTTATPQTRAGQSASASIGALLRSCWTLYLLTLRQHFHGKRWWVIGFLFLLPVGLAILIRATAPDVPVRGLEFVLAFMFIPQALLPLIALIYASGIIQDEQEEQTITYLLIRPIPKWAMYLVKLLATCTTTVILTAIFTALTYAAVYVGAGTQPESVVLRCVKAIAIHSLAVIAYCCLFGLLSLLTKRILVVGILYIAIIEGMLANFPISLRLATVIYYTRLIAYRVLNFEVTDHRGRTEDIASIAWRLDVKSDPDLLEHPEFATCLWVLAVASLVCAALAAWLCTQREFHVKTPEKA